jgi:hypothetical protein
VFKDRKLLLLILDAFSDRYLKFAPYLSKLCKEYYCSTIKPIFAYEGIRTAILTGLDTHESGVWHDKIFIPEGRKELKIRVLRSLISLEDKISPTDYMNKALRFLLYKIFREDYGTPHLIPPEYLEYFTTHKHENKDIPDLFQILEEHNIKSAWIEPKLNSMERRALKDTINLFKKYDFMVVKLNSLDRLGHKYGPLSTEVRERVKYLDSIVEEAISMLQSKINNFSFIIMSDHGMTPVEKTIDIEEILEKETRIKPLRDYIPYVGSTFASFYILNKKAEGIINEMLQSIGEYGKILSEKEVELLGINRELYGHIIFTLNEKIVFHPNFFQKREIPKGMHGYAFPRYDNAIFIALNTPHDSISLSLKYTDVFNTIIKILRG